MGSLKKLKKFYALILALALAAACLAGCGSTGTDDTTDLYEPTPLESAYEDETTSSEATDAGTAETGDTQVVFESDVFSLSDVAAYSGEPYVAINGNTPYFTESELAGAVSSYETYAELDELGRCGICIASIGQDIMPTEERGDISEVHPSGWHSGNDPAQWNRCHLIGFQLAGENDNEKNLITGTRYMNVDGMLPFENMVADYVKETNNHVLYRVTPIFEGDNLVASGVLMEAESVEDSGEGVLFCVYCYNVQPGAGIDYATGESWEDGSEAGSTSSTETTSTSGTESSTTDSASTESTAYILNTNSMKYHLPSCSSVESMSESNKEEYTGTAADLEAQGYEPCGWCLGD